MVFLRVLNNFRKSGDLKLPKRNFQIICDIYNQISKNLIKNKNFLEQTLIIILSETYYFIENGKKVFILEIIKNNEIFHQKEFWNDFINKSILKEVERNCRFNLRKHKEDASQKQNFEG